MDSRSSPRCEDKRGETYDLASLRDLSLVCGTATGTLPDYIGSPLYKPLLDLMPGAAHLTGRRYVRRLSVPFLEPGPIPPLHSKAWPGVTSGELLLPAPGYQARYP